MFCMMYCMIAISIIDVLYDVLYDAGLIGHNGTSHVFRCLISFNTQIYGEKWIPAVRSNVRHLCRCVCGNQKIEARNFPKLH